MLLGAVIAVLAAALVVGCLFLTGAFGRYSLRGTLTVGKDIAAADINDFYYTYDASANPPEYQRYRFYTEGSKYYFYHEKRAGNHWPLTEEDITVSGKKELSATEWQTFTDLLAGGAVRPRTEALTSGDAGPWLYIYWRGDGGKYQAFSFASAQERAAFEQLCKRLQTDL